MNGLKIGKQIRKLRLEHKMTQEELAELLGVSFQAVSKWENEQSLPDLTMLPVLADFFRVSMDELMGYCGKTRQKEIEKLSVRAWECRVAGDMAKATAILREGLSRYPGDEVLFNCLLYSMDPETENEEIIRIAGELSQTAAEA